MPSSHFCTHPLFFFSSSPYSQSAWLPLQPKHTHQHMCTRSYTNTHSLLFLLLHSHTYMNTHCCSSKDTPGQHLPAGEPKDPPLNTHTHTHTHTHTLLHRRGWACAHQAYLSSHTHAHASTYTKTHTNTHASTYTKTHIHTHIHTFLHFTSLPHPRSSTSVTQSWQHHSLSWGCKDGVRESYRCYLMSTSAAWCILALHTPPSSSSPLSIFFIHCGSVSFPRPEDPPESPSLVPVVAPKRQLASLPAPPPPPVLSSSLSLSLSLYSSLSLCQSLSPLVPADIKKPSLLPSLSPLVARSLSCSVQPVPPSKAQAVPTIWYHSVALYGKRWVAMTTADSTCFSVSTSSLSLSLSLSVSIHLFHQEIVGFWVNRSEGAESGWRGRRSWKGRWEQSRLRCDGQKLTEACREEEQNRERALKGIGLILFFTESEMRC